MSDCGCEFEAQNESERKTLIAVLLVNFVMFLVEAVAGYLAESTGLTADSLDMLADAGVYLISLVAIGRALHFRTNAALASGYFQVFLGLAVLIDVARRFLLGSDPISEVMMSIGLLALVANVACLVLLAKHRHGEVNMRASWIFSTNDVIANTGVILSGLLVAVTASRLPDLIVGLIISVVVVSGGIRIISDARRTRAAGAGTA